MDKAKEKQIGLYNKFTVYRNDREDRPGYKHEGCEYIVLDIMHDKNAPPAIRAYADAVERDGYAALAVDLRQKAAELEYRLANQQTDAERFAR